MRVDVDHQYVFVECVAAGEHLSVRIEGAAAAIKDQIVVAAHLIDVQQRKLVTLRGVPKHLLSQCLLADGKG